MPITQAELPSWAVLNEKQGEIWVDPDLVYPAYLERLGLPKTAYNVGVVRYCISRDLRDLAPPGEPFPAIRIKLCATKEDATKEDRDAAKERWGAVNLPTDYKRPASRVQALQELGGEVSDLAMEQALEEDRRQDLIARQKAAEEDDAGFRHGHIARAMLVKLRAAAALKGE